MDSFEQIPTAVNPWEKTPDHCLNRFIELSNIDHHSLTPKHQVDAAYSASDVARRIDLQRKMKRTATDIQKTCKQIADICLDRQSCDLTRADALDAKLKAAERLVHALESAIENQTSLVARLQQPYKGQHMKIEAEHHQGAVRMFENIANSLANLHEQCDTLKWSRLNGFGDAQNVQAAHDMSARIYQLQQELASAKALRSESANLLVP